MTAMAHLNCLAQIIASAKECKNIGSPEHVVLWYLANGLLRHIAQDQPEDRKASVVGFYLAGEKSVAKTHTPTQILKSVDDAAACTIFAMIPPEGVGEQYALTLRINKTTDGINWTVHHGDSKTEVDLSSKESVDRFYERASYALAYAEIRRITPTH